MTNEHPITPPLELVHQWVDMLSSRSDQAVFTMAAQWGADQELDACCEWLERNYNYPRAGHPLRLARRPKPPTLKEQALAVLMALEIDEPGYEGTYNTIRRALEALPND
jgi:hypothetical protein